MELNPLDWALLVGAIMLLLICVSVLMNVYLQYRVPLAYSIQELVITNRSGVC